MAAKKIGVNPTWLTSPRYKEGYFPVAPTDTLQDLRTEMVLEMEKVGSVVEAQHHEVATGGLCEIDMKYGPMVHNGRPAHALQIHCEECGAACRIHCDLYAEACV